MTIRLTLTAFVAFLFLFSCKKDDYQATNGKRLHKIINRWHDSLAYTMLKYDQQENLVEIKITSNNQPRDTTITTINYDSQNKMAGYTYAHNLRSWPSQSFVFSYDSEGHIVSKASAVGLKGQIYSYDKAGRLVADSFYYFSINSFIPRRIFKYDDKSNLIEWKYFYYNDYYKKLDSTGIYQASHYNQSNPYTNLRLTLFFITGHETYMLSKNNISEVRYNGTVEKYDYEYYSNGLPKKIIHNGDDKNYEEFFYE